MCIFQVPKSKSKSCWPSRAVEGGGALRPWRRRAGAAGLRLTPGCVAGAGLVGDPVHLPGLAAIGGEGLLEVRRAGGHARPVKADERGFAVDGVGGVEVAVAVAEVADLRRVEAADAAVGPVEPPLARVAIIEAKGQAFHVAAAGAVELDGVQLRAAVPDFVAGTGAGHVGPVGRAGKGMKHVVQLKGEVAEEGVEVVRAVLGSRRRGNRGPVWTAARPGCSRQPAAAGAE